MATPSAFGELLKQCRENKGWSQPDLAKASGVSVGYIGGIEAGHRGHRPSRDIVIKLARALGENPYVLLEAAGRLQASDDPTAKPTRPSFEQFVRGEPGLTDVEKTMLVNLYRSYVGPPSPGQQRPTRSR